MQRVVAASSSASVMRAPLLRLASWNQSSAVLALSKRTYAVAAGKDELTSKLQSGLKDAMRAKDSFTAKVLKSALADIQTLQHHEKPPSTISTLLSSLSKRREALKVYATQDRSDIVEEYEREIAILENYVPEDAKELTMEELTTLISTVMQDLSVAKGSGDVKQSLGKVLKEVKARAGIRAQNLGKDLADTIKRALA